MLMRSGNEVIILANHSFTKRNGCRVYFAKGEMKTKKNFSESQLKALKMLCDSVEQTLDREDEWDELSDALDVFAPFVYENWKLKKWHSDRKSLEV
jgi:hypothetical protein